MYAAVFWQHGEDEATLRESMRAIHGANIGAVCVESRPHPDFADQKWWKDMDVILDEAEMVWRYCFSACRRPADGSLKIGAPLDSIESDRAVILADGCKKAFVNSEKRELTRLR